MENKVIFYNTKKVKKSKSLFIWLELLVLLLNYVTIWLTRLATALLISVNSISA